MTDVHTLSGAYVLDALGPEEVAEFREHLSSCAACCQEVRELRAAAARMGAVETFEPPAELRARVLAAADRTPQVPPPPRSDQASVRTPALRRDRGGSFRRSRRWERIALAAAAVLVVGGGAIGIGQVLDDSSRSGGTPAEQVFSAEDAQEVAARTLNGGELLVAVSRSQDRMAVDTSELPELEGERVYQLWTIEADTVSSVGVFESPGETADMPLPGGEVKVALTIEPPGGSEQPTNEPIVEVDPAAV